MTIKGSVAASTFGKPHRHTRARQQHNESQRVKKHTHTHTHLATTTGFFCFNENVSRCATCPDFFTFQFTFQFTRRSNFRKKCEPSAESLIHFFLKTEKKKFLNTFPSRSVFLDANTLKRKGSVKENTRKKKRPREKIKRKSREVFERVARRRRVLPLRDRQRERERATGENGPSAT